MIYWPVYLVVGTIVVVTIVGGLIAWRLNNAPVHVSRRRAAKKPAGPADVQFAGTVRPRHLPALVAGSFYAVQDRQVVDVAAYGKRFTAPPDYLDYDRDDFQSDIAHLLGPSAQVVSPQLTLLQELLAQRARVGPDLWRLQIDDRFEDWGLPLSERAAARVLMDRIDDAEQRMRHEGLLAVEATIPSVATVHWALGVRLTRIARARRAFDDAILDRWLDRADQLVAEQFGSDVGTVLASLLLPAAVFRNDYEFRCGLEVGRELVSRWGTSAQPVTERDALGVNESGAESLRPADG